MSQGKEFWTGSPGTGLPGKGLPETGLPGTGLPGIGLLKTLFLHALRVSKNGSRHTRFSGKS